MDTLVDPNEVARSSGRLECAAPAPPGPPRGSFPTLEPDGTQWFERVFVDEASSSVDVEVAWDEESDTAPTLVMTRRRLLG